MQLLETDRLLLRPFTLDDAEGLYAYASQIGRASCRERV